MSFKVKNVDEKERIVEVEILGSKEELKDAIQTVYVRNKHYFAVPGFRKGKVPFNVVKNHYGIEMFYQEAAEVVVENNLRELAEDKKLVEKNNIALNVLPNVDVEEISEEAGIKAIAKYVMAAKVELKEYKGLTVEEKAVKVLAKDVDEEIKAEAAKNARIESVSRKSKKGDIVNIDFEGFVDGVAFEGGKAEGFDLELGSGSFIPGYEEQLEGKKAGEEVEVKVTFPAEYHAENLAGKESIFKVTVNEVKAKNLPTIDDEFAKDLGFDDLASYKKDVKAKLEETLKKEAEADFKNKVLTALTEKNEVVIAHEEVHSMAHQRIHQMEEQYKMYGITLEQMLQMQGKTIHQYAHEMMPVIENQLKLTYILREIAKVEKIKATKKEIEAKLEEQVLAYGQEDNKEEFMKNESILSAVKEMIETEKAQNFVFDNAKAKKAAAKKSEK